MFFMFKKYSNYTIMSMRFEIISFYYIKTTTIELSDTAHTTVLKSNYNKLISAHCFHTHFNMDKQRGH